MDKTTAKKEYQALDKLLRNNRGVKLMAAGL